MKRGEIWWVDLGRPSGSEPGYRRPAVIVSSNEFNATTLPTVIVAYLTTNAGRALDPGNVWLSARQSGLPSNSTVNVTQLGTVNRRTLNGRVGRLPDSQMDKVDTGLRVVLGLD